MSSAKKKSNQGESIEPESKDLKTAPHTRKTKKDQREETEYTKQIQASPTTKNIAEQKQVPAEPASDQNKKDQRLNFRTRYKRPLILGFLAVLVVLVTFEVTVLLKSKIERNRTLTLIGSFGERGGSPNTPGKFWGQLYLRNDEQGRLLVVDHAFNKILIWNKEDGSHIIDLDKRSVQKENFAPSNVDVDGAGNIIILDKPNQTVSVFSVDYKFLRQWPVSNPGELAVNQQGDIFIVDYMRREVVRYDSEGQELGRFGKGKLFDPRHMDTDERGNIYVMDVGRKCVQVFSARGKAKQSWSIKFMQPFNYPVITVQDDKVYVSEITKRMIYVFSLHGKLIWEMGERPIEPFTVDKSGILYMTGPTGVYKYQIEKK